MTLSLARRVLSLPLPPGTRPRPQSLALQSVALAHLQGLLSDIDAARITFQSGATGIEIPVRLAPLLTGQVSGDPFRWRMLEEIVNHRTNVVITAAHCDASIPVRLFSRGTPVGTSLQSITLRNSSLPRTPSGGPTGGITLPDPDSARLLGYSGAVSPDGALRVYYQSHHSTASSPTVLTRMRTVATSLAHELFQHTYLGLKGIASLDPTLDGPESQIIFGQELLSPFEPARFQGGARTVWGRYMIGDAGLPSRTIGVSSENAIEAWRRLKATVASGQAPGQPAGAIDGIAELSWNYRVMSHLPIDSSHDPFPAPGSGLAPFPVVSGASNLGSRVIQALVDFRSSIRATAPGRWEAFFDRVAHRYEVPRAPGSVYNNEGSGCGGGQGFEGPTDEPRELVREILNTVRR